MHLTGILVLLSGIGFLVNNIAGAILLVLAGLSMLGLFS